MRYKEMLYMKMQKSCCFSGALVDTCALLFASQRLSVVLEIAEGLAEAAFMQWRSATPCQMQARLLLQLESVLG